jgi:hypothetical protein
VSYYYLVAGLPALVLGENPPVTPEAFRFSCIGVLKEEDLRDLDFILAGRAEQGTSEFSRNWFSAETQLRNAVVRFRGSRLGMESRGFVKDHPGFIVSIEKAVADAFAKGNPLEREMALDRARWQILDELALKEPFGLAAVLAFAVKLQIVSRWAQMKDEEGLRRVEELVGKMAMTTME